VGLGTLVTILATTAAADITGVVLASVIAVLGLFVIPARKRIAKNEMRTKVADLRTNLITALRAHFEREIERSLQHIQDAIAPYTRFVKAERTKLTDSQAELDKVREDLIRLRVQIEEIR
jgi:hypothetical protein